jgi:hypothetical protein
MARYYASPAGTSVMQSGGVFPPPEDWTEITEEDYHQRLTEHGQNFAQMPVRNLADIQPEEPAE